MVWGDHLWQPYSVRGTTCGNIATDGPGDLFWGGGTIGAMTVHYKLRHSINNTIYGYAILHFCFFYVWLLSLYPGKRSKKHGQSFAEHAVSSPARSSLA